MLDRAQRRPDESPSLDFPLVLLLAAGHFMAFVDRAVPSVYAPALKAGFHLTDTQLGALQGPAFVTLYTIATLATGHRGHRLPRGALLAGSAALWTLATMAMALAQTYAGLLASRLVLGLAQAVFAPTALAVIVASAPAPRLSRWVSVFTSGSSMGRSGALLAGGLALGVFSSGALHALVPTPWTHAPWRAAIVLLTLPNLILVVLLAWRLRGRDETTTQGLGLGAALAHLAARPAGLGLHFLAAGAVILMVQAAAAWAPSIVNRACGLGPAASALLAGLVVLVAAPAGHLGGGWLLDRRRRDGGGPALVVAGGAVAAALGALVLSRAASPALAAAALFLVTAGGGAAALAALAGLQPLSPPALRPAINGLYLAFVTVAGLGFGPLLTGVVSDRWFAGPHGLAMALAVVLALAGSLAALAAFLGAGPWRRLARDLRETASA
ncbi:MFS transporter [Caulobacter hibisci]|uniref:MFS transporter n=1 Tax=Caulobacter hibisci TaxID=2035993 RepID=A0ABS0SYL6_9CAUL|nr:MFS transporter [Caulobacter hibisci]MBI1684639.1 MFS transporter [Caulobacter hibisci]